MGILSIEVNFMENNSKDTKSNKMFFVAVAISLLMILVACIVVYPQAISPEISDLAEITETTTQSNQDASIDEDDLSAVENIETNIPKDTPDISQSLQTQQITTTLTTTITEIPSTSQNDINLPIDYNDIKMPIINGKVINEFSNGELVKSATSGIWQTHNGVDISADPNATVEAIKDGTVIKIYEDALLGVCVSIDHTDFIANYCNLDKVLLVSEGDKVTIGDIIGNIGNTAVSETALDTHLHLEVLQGGKFVNPLDIIGK